MWSPPYILSGSLCVQSMHKWKLHKLVVRTNGESRTKWRGKEPWGGCPKLLIVCKCGKVCIVWAHKRCKKIVKEWENIKYRTHYYLLMHEQTILKHLQTYWNFDHQCTITMPPSEVDVCWILNIWVITIMLSRYWVNTFEVITQCHGIYNGFSLILTQDHTN